MDGFVHGSDFLLTSSSAPHLASEMLKMLKISKELCVPMPIQIPQLFTSAKCLLSSAFILFLIIQHSVITILHLLIMTSFRIHDFLMHSYNSLELKQILLAISDAMYDTVMKILDILSDEHRLIFNACCWLRYHLC